MSVPSSPKERFQYYYDVANFLDETYQEKIDNVNSERYGGYDAKSDPVYKKQEKENIQGYKNLENEKLGNYAEFSEGYDNSMQGLIKEKIDQQLKEANDQLARELENKHYESWLNRKNSRIAQIKQKYAKAFGNAIYNMQKANEDITKEKYNT